MDRDAWAGHNGSFRAHQSTAQLDVVSARWTKVLFQTEDWDASGWYDPATSSYTPRRAGVCLMGACVGINPSVSGRYVTVAVYKNGAEYARLGQSHAAAAADAMLVTGAADVFANGTTDYFEIHLLHNFGVNTSDLLADPKFTYFTGRYAGAA